MDPKPDFGQLLEKYLNEQGRSGSWLAERLGMSRTTINRWRNGVTFPQDAETVGRVADIFSVSSHEREALFFAAGYVYRGGSTAHAASDDGDSSRADSSPLRAIDDGDTNIASASLPNRTYRSLINREKEQGEILEGLRDPEGRWILVVEGIGGIGKTALALEAAYRCSELQLFENIVWVNVTIQPQGISESRIHMDKQPIHMTFEMILHTIASQLALPDFMQLDPPGKLARVQAVLRRRRILLILDSLETSEGPETMVAQLLPLMNPSKVLCTSRQRLLHGVYSIRLGGLPQQSAFCFLTQEGRVRQRQSLSSISELDLTKIIDATGATPLAMKLVVGQLDYLSINQVTQRLQQTPNSSMLPRWFRFYQASYESIWRNLSSASRKLLVALTLFQPGSGSHLELIQTVCDLGEDQLLLGLDELWHFSLIERREVAGSQSAVENDTFESSVSSKFATAGPQEVQVSPVYFYYLHPLTHLFVRQEALHSERASAEEEAEGHLYTKYLSRCIERAIGYLIGQVKEYDPAPPPELDRQLVMRVLDDGLHSSDQWGITIELMLTVAPKMEQAGHRNEWLPYLEKGIAECNQRKEYRSEAELHYYTGIIYQLLNKYPPAQDHLQTSSQLFEQVAEPHSQAKTLNQLAFLARLQNNHEEATSLAQKALTLLDAEAPERASSYSVLGAVFLDRKEAGPAMDYFQRALQIWREQGHQRMIARRLRDLGVALRLAQDYMQAIDCYLEAIGLFEAVGDRVQKAVVQLNLGILYLRLDDPYKAMGHFQAAGPIFEESYDLFHLATLTHGQGSAYCQMEEWREAKEAYMTSIDYWQESGHKQGLANVLTEFVENAPKLMGQRKARILTKSTNQWLEGLWVQNELPPLPVEIVDLFEAEI